MCVEMDTYKFCYQVVVLTHNSYLSIYFFTIFSYQSQHQYNHNGYNLKHSLHLCLLSLIFTHSSSFFFFFFNNPAPPEFSPLPLHAPLPISPRRLPGVACVVSSAPKEGPRGRRGPLGAALSDRPARQGPAPPPRALPPPRGPRRQLHGR